MKLLIFLGAFVGSTAAELPDFDKLWDYNKPAQTEQVFRGLVPAAKTSGNLDYYLQLLTQIGRTLSLQAKFDDAHQILNEVEPQLSGKTLKAEARYHLERGRTFRSSKKVEQSLPHFVKAFELSEKSKFDALAIDAVHMIAMVEKDPEKQLEWNFKAVAMAKASTEPRANGWLASLYNNIGVTYLETKRYEDSLKYYEMALELRVKAGAPYGIRVGKWCVARAMRSLGRIDEALTIQLAIEPENQAAGDFNGYTFEELAYLYEIKGDNAKASDYAAKAYPLLLNGYLPETDSRILKLKQLAG